MGRALHDLAAVSAPRVLCQLVALLYLTIGPMTESLDFLEYFASELAVA